MSGFLTSCESCAANSPSTASCLLTSTSRIIEPIRDVISPNAPLNVPTSSEPAGGSDGAKSPRPTAAAARVSSSSERVARVMKNTNAIATAPIRSTRSAMSDRRARRKPSENSLTAVDERMVHGGDVRLTNDAVRRESRSR